jgi:hypothetical protein
MARRVEVRTDGHPWRRATGTRHAHVARSRESGEVAHYPSSNALVIVALIPLALKGVRYRPLGAGPVLRRNLWIYGVGGVLIPFPGIKLIDMILVGLGWV